MKGHIDRIFGPGFAHGTGAAGHNPLLKERKTISFTSGGASSGGVVSGIRKDVAERQLDRLRAPLARHF